MYRICSFFSYILTGILVTDETIDTTVQNLFIFFLHSYRVTRKGWDFRYYILYRICKFFLTFPYFLWTFGFPCQIISKEYKVLKRGSIAKFDLKSFRSSLKLILYGQSCIINCSPTPTKYGIWNRSNTTFTLMHSSSKITFK